MPAATWILGVMLAVTSSVISNLGLNLQKRAHLSMEKAVLAAKEAASHTRRQRTGSIVTFGGNEKDAAEQQEKKDNKPINPLSPTGILRKSNGSSCSSNVAGGEYHRMEEAPDAEEAMVRRDEARREEVRQAAALAGGFPVGSPALTADAGTLAAELAQGGVDLETYKLQRGDKVVAQGSGASTASPMLNGIGQQNGAHLVHIDSPSQRSRSMSAATGGSRSHSHRSGHSSRYSSRRRGSLMVESGASGSGSSSSHPHGSHGSHGHPSAAPAATPPPNYTRNPIWVIGMVCVILGSLFDFAALAFVDQAVVAPLGSLTLVSNVFFGPCLLKEKVNRKQLYCTALIIAGSILAVAFAPHSDVSPNIDQMFGEFVKVRFIFYAIITCITLGLLRYASYRCNLVRRRDAMGAYLKVARYHTFCYASLAGIMGAQSVLFAKCTAMLLAASFAGDGLMFVHWGTYFVLLGLGVTIFLQIRWLNSGLRRFPAMLIVPIFQSFWILVSVIAGMIFFGEYEGVFSKTANAIMFPTGLMLTITGVFFLTRIAAPGASEESAAAAGGAGAATPAGTVGGVKVSGSSKRRRSMVAGAGAGGRRGSSAGGSAAPSPATPGTSHASWAGAEGVVGGGGRRGSRVSTPSGAAQDPSASSASNQPLGTSSSPLLSAPAGGAGKSVADHYGVPQSPRDPSPLNPGRVKPLRAPAARMPVDLDRVVDQGSYSDNRESLLAHAVTPGGGEREEDDDDFERRDAADRPEVSDECGDSCSGSEGDEEDDGEHDDSSPDAPSTAANYHQLMMHSLAPLNFPMLFLPASLMEESSSPRGPVGYLTSPSGSREAYFAENSSGFNGGEGVGLGGLPYANIFRVREDEEEVRSGIGRTPQGSPRGGAGTDEENPAPAPSPSGGGVNLFASNPRVKGSGRKRAQRMLSTDNPSITPLSSPVTHQQQVEWEASSASASSSNASATRSSGSGSGSEFQAPPLPPRRHPRTGGMDIGAGAVPPAQADAPAPAPASLEPQRGLFDPSPASSLMGNDSLNMLLRASSPQFGPNGGGGGGGGGVAGGAPSPFLSPHHHTNRSVFAASPSPNPTADSVLLAAGSSVPEEDGTASALSLGGNGPSDFGTEAATETAAAAGATASDEINIDADADADGDAAVAGGSSTTTGSKGNGKKGNNKKKKKNNNKTTSNGDSMTESLL